METQRERLLQKFTPEYEEVVNLNQQIVATKAQIRNEIQQIISMEESALHALDAEEGELQAAESARSRVPSRDAPADSPVVAVKSLRIAVGAEPRGGVVLADECDQP
jgi:uncharacterized protein involved in exopolysaccharide biosynthesis